MSRFVCIPLTHNRFFIAPARFVLRCCYDTSGTAGSGATIRVYLERHVSADSGSSAAIYAPVGDVLGNLAAAAVEICRMRELTGMVEPTVIT